MLGILRFILAYFVFLSHFPENGLKLGLGVTSVIIFYFISGYLMMKSYSRFKKYTPTPIRSFYMDRVIKIFPQYLIVLILTVIFFNLFGNSTHNTYRDVSFETTKVLFDASLLPVNFSIGALGNLFPNLSARPIVPPAWSLSVEFHFYLLLPFLVMLKTRSLTFITIISTACLTISFFTKDPLFDTLNFGYRYILPMLVVFIFGMLFSSKNKKDKKIAFIIWVYFCFLLIGVLPSFPAWYHFAVQEITVGIVIALPLFHYAINFKPDNKWLTRIDHALGDLSYPVFLSHYLGIYLAQHIFGVSSHAKIYFLVASLLITLLLSICLALLQRRIDSNRINLRGFSSLRAT